MRPIPGYLYIAVLQLAFVQKQHGGKNTMHLRKRYPVVSDGKTGLKIIISGTIHTFVKKNEAFKI
jgi:hypothetical protein